MTSEPEKGSSSLLMVLMLFAIGSLMLRGLSQQLADQHLEVAGEIHLIQRYAAARSGLAWGAKQRWLQQKNWQCLAAPGQAWRACLYQTEKGEALLAASSVGNGEAFPLTLWRWGMLREGRLIASAHGWLDFCPLLDSRVCDLPR